MNAPAQAPPATSAIQLRLTPASRSSSEPAVPSAANASGTRFFASRPLHAAGLASDSASHGRLRPNTAIVAISAMKPSASGRTKNMLMNNASSQAQKKAEPMMILMPVVPCTRSSDFMHPLPTYAGLYPSSRTAPSRLARRALLVTVLGARRQSPAGAGGGRRVGHRNRRAPRGGDVVGDGSFVVVIVGADWYDRAKR